MTAVTCVAVGGVGVGVVVGVGVKAGVAVGVGVGAGVGVGVSWVVFAGGVCIRGAECVCAFWK